MATPATLLPSLHGVTVDGKPVSRRRRRGCSATTSRPVFDRRARPEGAADVYDRLPQDLPRLMPVGRLDLNTEGLLLLTTDGELKRQLELPATGVERSYRARVFGEVSQARLEELIHGIEIEGIRYGAIDANLERRTGRNGWVEMRCARARIAKAPVMEHLGLRAPPDPHRLRPFLSTASRRRGRRVRQQSGRFRRRWDKDHPGNGEESACRRRVVEGSQCSTDAANPPRRERPRSGGSGSHRSDLACRGGKRGSRPGRIKA